MSNNKIKKNLELAYNHYEGKEPKLFGSPNTKLRKDGYRQFTLPAVVTCPGAGDCKKFCFADDPASMYNCPNVKIKHWYNFYRTLDLDTFQEDAIEEISRWKKTTPSRIHDAGDMYNVKYYEAWKAISNSFQDRIFYAYTKSFDIIIKSEGSLKTGWITDNLFIRLSYGSSNDELIDPEIHHHSKVFQDNEVDQAIQDGYTFCPTDSDAMAHDETIIKLGLHLH